MSKDGRMDAVMGTFVLFPTANDVDATRDTHDPSATIEAGQRFVVTVTAAEKDPANSQKPERRATGMTLNRWIRWHDQGYARAAKDAITKNEEELLAAARRHAHNRWQKWATAVAARKSKLPQDLIWPDREVGVGERKDWYVRHAGELPESDRTKDTQRRLWMCVIDLMKRQRKWADSSRANFSNGRIPARYSDFSGLTFPGEADFSRCTFEGAVDFSGCTFDGDADFGRAVFNGHAAFKRLGEGTNKQPTRFNADARFTLSKFVSGYVEFEFTEFHQSAQFRQVDFKAVAFVTDCVFESVVWAPQVTFNNYVSFKRTKFLGYTVFGAMQSMRAMSLDDVVFTHVPDFIEAEFKQPPVLDAVKFQDLDQRLPADRRLVAKLRRSFNRDNAFRDWLSGRNRSAMWRNLRRIAVQGLDNDSEQKFLAAEIRTRRVGYVKADINEYNDFRLKLENIRKDRGLNTETEVKEKEIEGRRRLANSKADEIYHARYILGKAFGLFSDFGRSVLRPVASLMIVCVLAWACYVGMHLQVRLGAKNIEPMSYGSLIAFYDSLACLPGPKAVQRPPSDSSNEPTLGPRPNPPPSFNPARNGPLLEALYFTVGKALIISTDPQDRVPQAQACLFGRFDTASASGPFVADRAVVPNSPFWVNAVAAIQTLLCTAFLFLLGLALRNKFKMR